MKKDRIIRIERHRYRRGRLPPLPGALNSLRIERDDRCVSAGIDAGPYNGACLIASTWLLRDVKGPIFGTATVLDVPGPVS